MGFQRRSVRYKIDVVRGHTFASRVTEGDIEQAAFMKQAVLRMIDVTYVERAAKIGVYRLDVAFNYD
jgi:hypothetical protein